MTNIPNLHQLSICSAQFINHAAEYRVSHSSTILSTSKGTLLATWHGGSERRAPDVKIYIARMVAGRWLAPQIVAVGHLPDGSPIQCWNPVLYEPQGGPLLLFYKVGPSPSEWWGMLKTSIDDGRTWSEGEKLPTGYFGPIRNKPVQLPNGAILCPGSTEGHPVPPNWRIHFELTTDLGLTWERIAVPCNAETPDAIQPVILTHQDGRLQAIGRTKVGLIYTTISTDNGQTWEKVQLTTLPNPNSGIDALRLHDGRFALVYNHNPTPAGLTPLNLALSNDGLTWQATAILEHETGDYAYPSITQSPDNMLHITYSWNFQKIKHVVIDPQKLQQM